MNGEWNLLIGALIGFVASILGYTINHILELRKESVLREYEMRKEGREFLLSLYGFLSYITDLVEGYVRAVENTGLRQGKAQVLLKRGFLFLTPNEITKEYVKKYKEFTKFMGQAREKGNEALIPLDLSYILRDFWAYADRFYEWKDWDENLKNHFNKHSKAAMDRIEELLGLKRRGLIEKPKWLKPREVRTIMRGSGRK